MTRRELEGYRSAMRELEEIRSRLRKAEIRASQSKRKRDKEDAWREEKIYDAQAKRCADELERIEREIERIADPTLRRVLRIRYIDGCGRVKTAMRMSVSESTVDKWTEKALNEIGRER